MLQDTSKSGDGESNVTALHKGKGGGKRRGRTGRTGRTDKGGQEAVMSRTVLMEKMPALKKLLEAKTDAEEDWSEGVKKAAEASGFLAKTVARYVKAEVGDKYDDQKKEVAQLSLLFEVEQPFLKG